ncbi:MAG TPA: GntR family transcriptional regulator [Acidobacteriaceae bacterium]|jgi:DNA-binding GntR family transcriptional regulator|nr:GntR family transcriptional regulator [Acidobacteriaceae bacterium]
MSQMDIDIEDARMTTEEANGGIGALDRSCMHDRICWTILDRISDGTYQPGDRLKELTLAREFQVSQAPVREALRKLEAVRVLELEPYRGTRVRAISPRELRDTYELRGVLEQAATQYIRGFAAADVEYLEKEFAAMQAAVVAGDLLSVALHNKYFHCHIVLCCENKELVRVWKSLGIGMRSRLNVQRMADSHRLPEAVATHGPIIEAFRAGDLKLAGDLLRKHSFQAVEDLE